jgi:regulator of nucleoside diphosphate kinase
VNDVLPRIHVTDQDWRRLTSLVTIPLGPWTPQACAFLDGELARAEVVPARAVGPDVVTMNSRVCFEVGDGGRRCTRTLVYPWDADPNAGRLSVLSPLGVALLGLSVGDVIPWALPDGSAVRVRVLEILYQPEAEGHWFL